MTAEASTTSPLLFNWAPPRARRLAIMAFMGGSVLIHAICFYLFQIVYAPSVVLLPPPARVSLIAPDSEDARSLLRWVDAEDPALASATQRSPDARQRSLPKVPHIPSYMAEGPKLKHAPPLVLETRAPSLFPPGPVPPPPPASPAIFGTMATGVSFSDEFASFGPLSWPAAHFSASTRETPQAVRFRIAVAANGEVRHCFPLNSSGDSSLDEQARQHLALVRFSPKADDRAPTDPSDTWGIATIDWGNDVARPAAPASPTSAP